MCNSIGPLSCHHHLLYCINMSVLTNLEFQVSGHRIIDQGLELFFRLMMGGTLPARKLHIQLDLKDQIPTRQYEEG